MKFFVVVVYKERAKNIVKLNECPCIILWVFVFSMYLLYRKRKLLKFNFRIFFCFHIFEKTGCIVFALKKYLQLSSIHKYICILHHNLLSQERFNSRVRYLSKGRVVVVVVVVVWSRNSYLLDWNFDKNFFCGNISYNRLCVTGVKKIHRF